MEITAVRVFYSKTGRAKYISHLDTMRTFTRALRRSGLPLWYTQGFNPHLYITFALPIPLGYEGLRESFDIKLTKETDPAVIDKSISAVMPAGFRFVRAATPVMEPSAIKYADYDVRLIYSGGENEAEKAINSLGVFERQPLIEVEKKTKKGIQAIDIKPHTEILSHEVTDNEILLKLRMAAGTSLNINPSLFLKAFYQWSDILPEGVRVTRTAILSEKMTLSAAETAGYPKDTALRAGVWKERPRGAGNQTPVSLNDFC